eukprot:gene1117-1092_t
MSMFQPGAPASSAVHPSDSVADPLPPQRVELLDDPQEWLAFGRPCTPAGSPLPGGAADPATADAAATAWDSHVVLEGMHCAACALTIEDALRAVPGVLQADVSAATRRARVVWQPGQVKPSQWMEAVRHAGYRAMPAMDAFARDQRLRESRRALWRWLVAGFCMMQVMMYAWPAYVAQPGDLSGEMEQLLRWASWVITLPMVVFSCGPFFTSALRDIRLRRVSMDLPVALGMAITFVVSTAGTFDPAGIFGEEVYYDSLTMFVFFLLTGRWLELRLRDRTAGALEAVMNRLPDSVERRAADGSFARVATRRIGVGDTIRVLPGEAFPADGRITAGNTHADEALLTGESTPVARPVGSSVTAGSYNLQAPVEVLVEGTGGQTRFAQIVALMESASLQKPRLAQLADRIARPFLVAVLLAAALAAAYWWPSDPGHALMVAVAVLIVTCPCALSLATPVAMLTAAGTLARHGVLVRNLQGLEALAQVDTMVFDKTGTLTRDGMALQAVHPAGGFSAQEALDLAAALARQSMHPASRALAAAASAQQLPLGRWQVMGLQEDAGQGLTATVEDPTGAVAARTIRLGSARHAGVANDAAGAALQVVLSEQAADGALIELARFDLVEDLRAEASAVVQALQQDGVAVQLLSGDRRGAVQRVATQAGIAHAKGECTPQGKLEALQALQLQGHHVAMVGDGLNDGPVLAGAHVSFAFGRAVPLAQSRADFVVLGDSLALVPQTVLLARRTLRVVRQNLWWAAAYNALCVPLAVLGWMPAWLAGLGMALSSLLVVLNAARLARDLPSLPGSQNPTGARLMDILYLLIPLSVMLVLLILGGLWWAVYHGQFESFSILAVVVGVVGMLVGVIIAAQLAWPELNFGIPWLSYGRLRPLHTNAVIFGFGGSALFATSYYVVQRTCQVRLFAGPLAAFTFWGWVLVIAAAVVSLPMGYTQGKEYAELEWPIDILITLVWVSYAIVFFGTIGTRKVKHIYVANWFFGAFILAVALLHLVNSAAIPAGMMKSYSAYAGVQDAMVQWWYGHNAVGFFLTAGFLGMMYYFIPKQAGRPVYSYRLSIVHFWALIFTYMWAGPHHLHYTALPDWTQSVGMVFSLILLAPSWGGMINGIMTLSGAWHKLRDDPILRFLIVSLSFYGMSTFEGPMMSIKTVNALSHYTDWTIGHVHSGALGWVGLISMGSLYYLVPRLFGKDKMHSVKAIELHFWMATIGIVLYIAAMWIAGVMQGLMWRAVNPDGTLTYTFVESVKATYPFYVIRVAGGLLYLGGMLVMAWNVWLTAISGRSVKVAIPAVNTAHA